MGGWVGGWVGGWGVGGGGGGGGPIYLDCLRWTAQHRWCAHMNGLVSLCHGDGSRHFSLSTAHDRWQFTSHFSKVHPIVAPFLPHALQARRRPRKISLVTLNHFDDASKWA